MNKLKGTLLWMLISAAFLGIVFVQSGIGSLFVFLVVEIFNFWAYLARTGVLK